MSWVFSVLASRDKISSCMSNRSVTDLSRRSAQRCTHFLMKTLPKVATEMALHVLAYNLTRVMNIVGIKPLLASIRA
jgi:hypothetical protein